MAPCHVLTKRFAFTRAIPRGVSQIPKYLVKKAGDSLEGFERLLLHYSGNSIGVARWMAQRAANRIRLFGVEPTRDLLLLRRRAWVHLLSIRMVAGYTQVIWSERSLVAEA